MSKTYFDSFYEKVKKGVEGEMTWIPSPYKRLKNQIGIIPGVWTIVGGDPGTGKSAFTDTTYIHGPYEWYRQQDDVDLKIILRSMERSKEKRIAKWVCRRLYNKYGLLIDVKTILGMHSGDSPINKDVVKAIRSCKKYFDRMQEEVLTVIDGRINPTGVLKDFEDYALRNGQLYRRDRDGNLLKILYDPNNRKKARKRIKESNYPDNEPKPERSEFHYIPDNDNEIVIPIVDHIGEYEPEDNLAGKQLLDRAGKYTKRMRDRYNYSPVDVIQFNRNLSDSRRRQGSDLQPEEQDFMGSSTMFQRADIALALFNPHRYGINKHLGYNIQSFVNRYNHNRFRSLWVLKNTYGVSDYGTGMNFIGELGHYRQLPKAEELVNTKKYVDLVDKEGTIDLIVR